MNHGSLNRRAPLVALTLFFISSLFLPAATMQLVKNGDFSNGFTDWSRQSHGSYPQTTTSFAGYGTSIWLVSNSPGVGTASIQQAVAIPMGTESLSFSINMASWNFYEPDGYITVTANGATVLSSSASTSAAMTTLTASLDVATYPPGSTVILRVNGVIAENYLTVNYWIDNVSLIATGTTLYFTPRIVSGTLTDGVNPMAGASVTFSHDGHVATTAANGTYSYGVDYGTSTTITPSKTGYSTWGPAARTLNAITVDQPAQNFIGILDTFTISGTVTDGSDPIAGATVTFSYANHTETTDAAGHYSFVVPYGAITTITPSKIGYSTWSPASRSLSSVTADKPNQDFAGTIDTFPVSGTVTSGANPLAGVTITFSYDGHSVTTAADGTYSSSVPYDTSTTLTPAKSGYSIWSPPAITLANVTAAQADQDFAGTPDTFTVSGTITAGGSGLANVTLNGLPGNPVTDAAGGYSVIVNYGWSGTVTPSLSGYVFSPADRTYPAVISEQSGQDYAATFNAPVALAATAITATGFTANWNSATGASGYAIDVATDNGFASLVAGYGNLDVNNVTAFAVSGLPSGATYYYRLRAYNGSDTSGNSNAITVLTQPAAPVATAATAVTASGFSANWDAVTGAESFRLDVSTSNTFSAFVAGYQDLNVGSVTTYAVSGLAGGTTYYYRLRAVNASGTSADSNVIAVLSAPAVPVATAATAITASGFSANWGAVTGAASYRLDVSTSGTFGTFVAGYQDLDVNNVTTYAVSGLAGGTTYYYRLRAVNASGTSADSNVITVLSAPADPVATAATAITASGFTANWNSVTGAASYRLDVSTSNTFGTFVTSYQDLNVNNVTTYAVTGLAGGSTYYYRLRAVNASGTSANSNTITVLTVPAAPMATAATAVTSGGFTANWGAVTGAVGYYLDVATDGGFAAPVVGYSNLNVSNVTTFAVTGLAGGSSYYYRLRAVNASGTSADSNVITVLTIPAAPTATAATSVNATGFTANWGAVTGAASYRLDVSTSATFGTFVAGCQDLNVGNVTTYAVTGLAGGSTYYYRLRAVNAAGASADSNVITVLTVPAAPAATAATSVNATGFTANWGAVTGAAGYYLDVATDGGFAAPVVGYSNLNVNNVTSFAVTGLISSGTYYYRVRAANASGASADSNVITVLTLPAAPTATAATAITASGFTANWGAVTGATSYRLDVSTSGTFGTFVTGCQDLNVGNVTTHAVTGLAGGTTYYYRLRAVNASGTSTDSNVITVLTVPAAPVAAAASAIAATGFNANWGAVTGAASYRLDVSTSDTFGTFVAGYQDLNVNNVVTYSVSGLTSAATYYYRLRAVNASGTSADSNVITVLTVPAAPVATAATAITSATFQANWEAAAGASGYRLDVSPSNAFASYVAGYHDLDVGNGISFAVNGLASNTTYYYRLRAANATGSSTDSNVISLTTLQLHTVRFTASAGGRLNGSVTQTIDHGGDCTAVTAIANAGYRFIEWTGTGNFRSLKNPLTVVNVLGDMNLRAAFLVTPPTIRIVNPVHQSSVWGMVNIRAEAGGDLALRSIAFLVDGAVPLAFDANSGQAAGQARSELRLRSGDLYADLEGADMLLLDNQRHLRKLSFSGGLQPVLGNDLAVRDLALAGSDRVHLLFAEPLRLEDGRSYAWVVCDLKKGLIRGVEGAPAVLPFAGNTPAIQFDAQGSAFYFLAGELGAVTLVRRAQDAGDGAYATAAILHSVAGEQVRDWLVLPDASVLLSLYSPATAQVTYLKVTADGRHASQFAGGFASALRADADLTEQVASDRIRVSGGRLLASGYAGLGQSAWPALDWTRIPLKGIEVADMAADAVGNVYVAGREVPGDRLGLWSLNGGDCQPLAALPLPCVRVAVLASPAKETGAGDPVGPASGTAAARAAAVPLSCDWNTLLYANGLHQVSAIATDEAGAESRDVITVNVANVSLSLTGQRFSDHSWLITKDYVKVRLAVENIANAPAVKYVVYRRVGSGGEQVAREFLPNESQNGACEFTEAAPEGGQPVIYRAVALAAGDAIIGAASEITL